MVNTENTGANRNKADLMISKIVLERILVSRSRRKRNRDETKPKVVNA